MIVLNQFCWCLSPQFELGPQYFSDDWVWRFLVWFTSTLKTITPKTGKKSAQLCKSFLSALCLYVFCWFVSILEFCLQTLKPTLMLYRQEPISWDTCKMHSFAPAFGSDLQVLEYKCILLTDCGYNVEFANAKFSSLRWINTEMYQYFCCNFRWLSEHALTFVWMLSFPGLYSTGHVGVSRKTWSKHYSEIFWDTGTRTVDVCNDCIGNLSV